MLFHFMLLYLFKLGFWLGWSNLGQFGLFLKQTWTIKKPCFFVSAYVVMYATHYFILFVSLPYTAMGAIQKGNWWSEKITLFVTLALMKFES